MTFPNSGPTGVQGDLHASGASPVVGAHNAQRERAHRRGTPSSARSPRARRTASQREVILGLILVSPLVLLMLTVIGFPLINTVILSFQNQRVIGTDSTFVGFETYREVFSDGALWDAFRRSGVWLVGNLVLQTVLAFASALLLMRAGRWSQSARTWLLLPWVIPTVAVAVIWQWLTNANYGVVSKLFTAAGVEDALFFADSTWAMPTLIVMNSWHWFPLGAVIIYAALQTIPAEIYEAARVDGANALSMFRHITLPLVQPVLFALGLVGTLWSFNIIDSIYLVTRGGPVDSTTTAPVLIYDTAFKAFRASEAAAMSVSAIVLLGVLAWLYIRFAKPKDD